MSFSSMIVACVPVKNNSLTLAINSTVGSCDGCREEIYLAPSSQKAIEDNSGKVVTLCLDCVLESIKKYEAKGEKLETALLPGAIEEFKEQLNNF